MPTQLLRLCARAALRSLAFTAVSAAVAQNAYPNKPIRPLNRPGFARWLCWR